jgi:hypothetical protein
MTWAVALDGRSDEEGILLLLEDREEAESIAVEVRRRGHRVVVRPYPDPPPRP